MKKSLFPLIISLIMSCSALTACAAANDFSDVPQDSWYNDGVKYVSENGLMKGTGDNIFEPENSVTRGMLVTIIYRMEGSPESEMELTFKDVKKGSYYENAVKWAVRNNIVTGYNEKSFAPEDKITREQFAVILFRYSDYKEYDISCDNSLEKYSDKSDISEYAVKALKWANSKGYITGVSENTLNPKGYTTRAQAAEIIMRFDKFVSDSADKASDEKKESEDFEKSTEKISTDKSDKQDDVNRDELSESEKIDSEVTEIYAEHLKVNSGEKNVKMKVYLKNNPGILGMVLSVKYDDKYLKLTGAETGKAVKEILNFTQAKTFEPGCNFLWDGLEISDESIKDGEILTLFFDISENTPSGKYPISIIYEKGDIVNNNLVPVDVKILQGVIECE